MEGLILDPASRRDRIEGHALVLRRASWDDLPAIHEAMADPATMRFWSSPPHADLAVTRDWLASMIEADPALSDDFVIEHNGQPIGKLGCWRLPEIGFLLHPGHTGQGHASHALALFMAYIAGRGVPRIEADVDPRNQACLKLLSRAGFHETGHAERTWQVGDEWCDSIYLARDLAEFTAAV